MKAQKHTITLQLPDDLYQKLKKESEDTLLTISAVVRLVLLNHYDNRQKDRQNKQA